MGLDLLPRLYRDDTASQNQLLYRERFSLLRSAFGVALLWGITYVLATAFRKAGGLPVDLAGYVMAFFGLAAYCGCAAMGLIMVLGRTSVLFDRATGTATHRHGGSIPFRFKTCDMKHIDECLVTAERKDDESPFHYTVRVVFKEGPDLEVWATHDKWEATTIADEINKFWGIVPRRNGPVLKDEQEELRKWLDGQK